MNKLAQTLYLLYCIILTFVNPSNLPLIFLNFKLMLSQICMDLGPILQWKQRVGHFLVWIRVYIKHLSAWNSQSWEDHKLQGRMLLLRRYFITWIAHKLQKFEFVRVLGNWTIRCFANISILRSSSSKIYQTLLTQVSA